MKQTPSAANALGIRYPIVQGPFGGGLSTSKLAALVSNAGGLGSYGAHLLEPAQLEALVRELSSLTAAPFAVNLWVSDHDPGGLDTSAASFERVLSLFRPYLRELGLEDPAPPELAEVAPYPMQSWFVSRLKAACLASGRSDLVSLWGGQIAPNLEHRSATTLMNSLIEELSV